MILTRDCCISLAAKRNCSKRLPSSGLSWHAIDRKIAQFAFEVDAVIIISRDIWANRRSFRKRSNFQRRFSDLHHYDKHYNQAIVSDFALQWRKSSVLAFNFLIGFNIGNWDFTNRLRWIMREAMKTKLARFIILIGLIHTSSGGGGGPIFWRAPL